MAVFLIPTALQSEVEPALHAPVVLQILSRVELLAAENAKTARRFIKQVLPDVKLEKYRYIDFDHERHSFNQGQIKQALNRREDIAIMSEAGCPGIADPGADVVRLAQEVGIEVIPLPGSCSFLMALMASGLTGQRFSFDGYLPHKEPDRSKRISRLLKLSIAENSSQIVMETPYRGQKLLEELLNALPPKTRLCIAYNMQGENGFIKTKTVAQWLKGKPTLEKAPAVFIFQG